MYTADHILMASQYSFQETQPLASGRASASLGFLLILAATIV